MIWSKFLFIRYAEDGELPVETTIRAVRKNLRRRERMARLPALSLSALVLVIAVIAGLIGFLPSHASQAFVFSAVQIAPSHVDTAPLDVGLLPADRLSASNSLAPMVAAYGRRHLWHHDRHHALADSMIVVELDGDGDASELPIGLRVGYANPQSVIDHHRAPLKEPLRA